MKYFNHAHVIQFAVILPVIITKTKLHMAILIYLLAMAYSLVYSKALFWKGMYDDANKHIKFLEKHSNLDKIN